MSASASRYVSPVLRQIPSAATLVVTYGTSRGNHVILTRRPTTMRRHPGQIAFPGGMIEPTDPTPFEAAVREAQEEIGLTLRGAVIPIELPQVSTLSSDIVIQPFWVTIAGVPRLRPSPDEVEAILRVPIRALRSVGALQSIPHPRRPSEQTLAYRWRGDVIWGATLITLRDLLDRIDD